MEYRSEEGVLLTDELLDALANEYEDGTWEGSGSVTRGRPRLYDEDTETISVRIPKSKIVEIDIVSKRSGESRSDFIRNAIDHALLAEA